jgi:hypothetical protein
MSGNLRVLTRVALFAALVFVFSYISMFLHNVNPSFFIVFVAGYLWGVVPGAGVGAVGIFLWSIFNPLGPPPLPILAGQVIGISFSAVIGDAVRDSFKVAGWNLFTAGIMVISGFLCGLFYHLVVDVIDAWLYQPFWPRLIGGLIFSLLTIVSNCIMFPLFYPVLKFMREREKENFA